MPERRAQSRVPIDLDAHLERKVGNDVAARTRDLSAHGVRLVSDRPLRVDEQLLFDVELPATHEHLRVHTRVLREQHNMVYALRFEHVDAVAEAAIEGLLRSGATS